jgi:hypothetical protein
VVFKSVVVAQRGMLHWPGLLHCYNGSAGWQVINEWKLEKDGVDVSLTDIANQTRDAQLDDRSTFLGLGPKRYCLIICL